MEDKKEQEIQEMANDIHEVSLKVGKELVEKVRYNLQAKNETIHIEKCDCMCMLDNWEESTGAKVEFFIANKLGIKIMQLRGDI